jgi:hypothetical protein
MASPGIFTILYLIRIKDALLAADCTLLSFEIPSLVNELGCPVGAQADSPALTTLKA